MVALSHPTGNVNVRQAALALAEANLLGEFWTCLNWNPDSRVARLLPGALRQKLARRAFPSSVRARARTDPWLEAARLSAARLGWHALSRHESGIFSVDAVYRHLDRRVARRLASGGRPTLQAVYAYEDGAAETFVAARERGLRCIYDLPIGYCRVANRIYREEAARTPGWAATMEGILDSAEKLARKEAEVKAADLIVVASRFTAETLAESPAKNARIEVIPYGAPEIPESAQLQPPPKMGCLRVIFVGALTQRKGLSYAFEAVRRFGTRIEFTLIGARPTARCAALDEALRAHRWIPYLSPADVLVEMRRHDVLIFPSLCDGFGLVILEALACGIPVISTKNTGAPDVLREGIDGFVVPIRSVDAIAEKLELLLDSPARLAAMKDAAAATARSLRWENYRSTIAHMVQSQISARAG